MTVLELIKELEKTPGQTLTIFGVLPKASYELEVTGTGQHESHTKIVLMMVVEFRPEAIHNNHDQLKYLKIFRAEGNAYSNKEVILTFTDFSDDGSCTYQCFPVVRTEVFNNKFRLIAGEEILSLRIVDPPGWELETE